MACEELHKFLNGKFKKKGGKVIVKLLNFYVLFIFSEQCVSASSSHCHTLSLQAICPH